MNEVVTLREHLEGAHTEYVSAHTREHIVHADAHAREHALNKEAIEKAENSVDKAVGAARETMDKSVEALGDRLDRAEAEQRRRMDEHKAELHQIGLAIAGLRTTAEGNIKGIQAIQESQGWVVRLVIGAVILAIIAWILRPGLI